MKRLIYLVLGVGLALVAMTATAFAGNLIEKHTTVSSKDRLYYVYQPDTCVAKQCPLVLMFHGMNLLYPQVEAAIETAKGYGWQAVADKNEFVIVFPSGLSLPPKSFWGTQYDPPAVMGTGNSQRWDIAAIPPLNPFGYAFVETQDTLFVEKIVSEMISNYKVLPTHVFSTGHSYGAFFSYYVTMYLNKKHTEVDRYIKAFAVHSAGLAQYSGVTWPPKPYYASSAVGTPGMIIYSANDPIIAKEWPLLMYNELNSKGHKPVLSEVVPGIGHLWDPSSNQKQWDFFMKNAPALPEPPPPPPPPPPPVYQCGDGLDNDGDGLIDLADPGCENASDNDEYNAPPPPPPPPPVYQCGDGLDNDSDGLIDLADPGCENASDNDEYNAPPPPPPPPPVYQCGDGLDNDSDGLIDLADPGCENASDNDEYNAPPPPVVVGFHKPEPYPYNDAIAAEDDSFEVIPVEWDKQPLSTFSILIYVNTEKSTAVEGKDFKMNLSTLVVKPNSETQVVEFIPMEDSKIEGDEIVVLELKILDGNAVVGINNEYTVTIVDSTVPPPPPPPVWEPLFLTTLFNNVGVVWQNSTENIVKLALDNYGTRTYSPPYEDYRVLDVEVSRQRPEYFWWGMWKYDNVKKAGLYRRASSEDDALNKVAYFDLSFGFTLKDFALNNGGVPYVLWTDGENAVVDQYSVDGVYKKRYIFARPATGDFQVQYIKMDRYNNIRLLWTNGSKFIVDTIVIKGLVRTATAAFDIPSGYGAIDFDRGWAITDLASRVFFVNADGTNAKVLKVNGTVKTFNFTAPEGYVFEAMETSTDGKIRLMLEGEKDVKVLKVNSSTGKVESTTTYVMK